MEKMYEEMIDMMAMPMEKKPELTMQTIEREMHDILMKANDVASAMLMALNAQGHEVKMIDANCMREAMECDKMLAVGVLNAIIELKGIILD